VQALRRIMVPAAPARLQLRRLHSLGLEDPGIAERVRGAVPELVELASGADTCSLLLTIRLTAAARAEDSSRSRDRLGCRPRGRGVKPNMHLDKIRICG
jgi:hypothetical protein